MKIAALFVLLNFLLFFSAQTVRYHLVSCQHHNQSKISLAFDLDKYLIQKEQFLSIDFSKGEGNFEICNFAKFKATLSKDKSEIHFKLGRINKKNCSKEDSILLNCLLQNLRNSHTKMIEPKRSVSPISIEVET